MKPFSKSSIYTDGGPFSTSLFPISITSSTPCSASPLIGAVVGAVIVLFVYGYFAGRKTA
jgi:uncharacterized membrane protein YeaQ/YmgE (transglycosylase-associated protein family)